MKEGSVIMNDLLGVRIRFLRESKGLTQEQVAEKMNCSRQKYARIEKGLIDISYANITKIANILGISTEEITSAVHNTSTDKSMFRGNNQTIKDEQFEYISEMIEKFYAHKRLYNRIKKVGDDNE